MLCRIVCSNPVIQLFIFVVFRIRRDRAIFERHPNNDFQRDTFAEALKYFSRMYGSYCASCMYRILINLLKSLFNFNLVRCFFFFYLLRLNVYVWGIFFASRRHEFAKISRSREFDDNGRGKVLLEVHFLSYAERSKKVKKFLRTNPRFCESPQAYYVFILRFESRYPSNYNAP